MRDWAVAFLAAALVCGLVVWCAYLLAPFVKALYVG